jgi:hypothetical protein
VPGLNPAHTLGLSGVEACHVRLVERLLGLGLMARSSRGAARVLRARRAHCGLVTHGMFPCHGWGLHQVIDEPCR